ncbi:hypothetical protein VTN77DRAFT_6551 [Rasamsonia byssochlamydoides]|uniref:uncharacterized protein n=1 Tax=Rasamsonia byssochlamydoides TaxID=89139 RepID=UPI003743B3CD
MAETDLDDDLTFSMESRNLSEDDEGSDGSSSAYHPALAEQPQNADKTAISSPTGPGQVTGFAGSKNNAEKPVSSEPSRRPLNLLDLPIDILKEIVKEITHTNDLTSLALTCSALHSLAVPHMYSRFDIVWPETVTAAEHPTGVDALSYGLATLVMGEHVFRETPLRPAWATARSCCPHCGCNNPNHQTAVPSVSHANGLGNLRLGNYYAQYTRKFSVGNGPSMWVQEYSITKETGKMLGTLVALAVARMVNLETFIWDMPTGVMRDVFLALASLADRPGHECRLEHVWVRWHDNSENPTARAIIPPPANSSSPMLSLLQRYAHVEFPTFSVLPPLKSLSVLDIDEPAYLEEMAVLIERSRHKLRELRIGMALRYSLDDWVFPVESRPVAPDPSPRRPTPGWPRVGGVLSILLSNKDENQAGVPNESSSKRGKPAVSKGHNSEAANASADVVQGEPNVNAQELASATQQLIDLTLDDKGPEPAPVETPSNVIEQQVESKVQPVSPPAVQKEPCSDSSSPTQTPDTKLKLEVLELERVYLAPPVLMKALDWRRLTTLTLLRCEEHEQLWRALRRQFSPTIPESPKSGHSKKDTHSSVQYHLKLKHLHTDRVSPYLLLFLKETIAPNSLESVFFQESNLYESIVGIEAIYRHVLRRQRLSLRKVLIDRSRRFEANPSSNHGHWRNWMLPRGALSFVTSGRMPQLRELGIGMDHRDWHFFLQRLPNIPQLRALYLPNMYDPTLTNDKKHRELALQILDIVTLRPEIKLCYIGIETKCFEILETSPVKEKRERSDDADYSDGLVSESSEADSDEADENEDEQDDDDGSTPGQGYDWESSSDGVYDGYSEEDEQNGTRSGVTFKIREILFYDDKISIFKARHCRL